MPRPLYLSRLSGILAVAGILGLFPSFAGADTPLANVTIKYDITIAGAGAAEFVLQAKLGTESYRVTGEGRTIGLIDMLAKMRFSGASQGTVGGGDIRPATHIHDYSERSRARHVKFTYDGNGKPKISANPAFKPSPNRVPLPDNKLAGTLDPVSIFVAPVIPGENPLSAAHCQRSFAVLDGRVRVDMRLRYLGLGPPGSLRGSNYDGPVLRCGAFINPVGGHKKGAFLTKLSRAKDIEVWLAPAAGGKYLVPVKLSLPTPVGRAELLARKLIDKPAGKQAALSD